MTQPKLCQRHRFPAEIIQYAVWLYHRFNLSHRDIEDLLAERSIEVSYEAIRLWCNKFGSKYAQRLRRKHQGYGDNQGSNKQINTGLESENNEYCRMIVQSIEKFGVAIPTAICQRMLQQKHGA